MPPLPPLRTVRATFTAHGSSGCPLGANALSSRTRCGAAPHPCTVTICSRLVTCLELPVKQATGKARQRRKEHWPLPRLSTSAFPFDSYTNLPVPRHQTEVCTVFCRVILLTLNPYLTHYKSAFAFSVFLYLLPCRHSLRFGFLYRRATGLPRFVSIPMCFRLCLYAEGAI